MWWIAGMDEQARTILAKVRARTRTDEKAQREATSRLMESIADLAADVGFDASKLKGETWFEAAIIWADEKDRGPWVRFAMEADGSISFRSGVGKKRESENRPVPVHFNPLRYAGVWEGDEEDSVTPPEGLPTPKKSALKVMAEIIDAAFHDPS